MEQITLNQVLQKLKGQDVKIGSKLSFIYCGLVDDEILEKLIVQDNKLIKRAKDILKDYKTSLNSLEKRYENKLLDLKFSLEKFRKLKNEKNKEKELIERNIERLEKYINSYENIINRKVRDVYLSLNGKTKIILIEGQEAGEYWSIKEFNAKNSKSNKKEKELNISVGYGL